MNLSGRLGGKDSFLVGNFLLLIISWVLMYSTEPIPDTYSSLYYLSLGATPFLLSVMFFVGSLAIAFVQFPGGYLTDSHGRRWLIVTMSFGLALGYLFFIFAPSWQFIVLGMIVQNLCLIYQPALLAMMIDSLSPDNRGAGFNFQSVVTNLVSLPAPLIAGALVLVFRFDLGMRIGYSIVLVAYLFAAALRVRLKETLSSTGNTERPRIADAFRNYRRCVRESWLVWRAVPRSAFHVFISSTLMNALVTGCQIYFVLYATSVLKISLSQWAGVMAFMFLSISLPAILIGRSMDAVGRKRFLVLGYLMHVPAMLLLINADFYRLLLAFFLYGLGHMLQVNSSQVILGDLVPRELRGKAVGCIQFFLYLTQAFAYLLIGFLYSYVSPSFPFLLLALASIPLAVYVALKVFEPAVKEV